MHFLPDELEPVVLGREDLVDRPYEIPYTYRLFIRCRYSSVRLQRLGFYTDVMDQALQSSLAVLRLDLERYQECRLHPAEPYPAGYA